MSSSCARARTSLARLFARFAAVSIGGCIALASSGAVSRIGRRAVAAVAAAVVLFAAHGAAQQPATTTVGIPARLVEIVLPGSELEVAPLATDAPLVVRIAATRKHGTAFRYDLEVTALEAGEYDVRSVLRRKDGTSAADLPPIAVAVRATLPVEQTRPHAPRALEVPPLGGYRTLLWVGGSAWVAGLAALVFWKRKRENGPEAVTTRPRSLAERLRPLVESARAGTLSREDRARLELSLVAYWRRRLALDELRPHEALSKLREHAEAGPLLRSLEAWLHAPAREREIDVAALLAPYRDLPADALDGKV